MTFPGKQAFFYLFLLQLMLVPVVLIVPNLTMVARLGLYDTLAGVMAPYFASAFGTFLMRQAFEAIPRELEDAALVDGAAVLQRIRHVYVPLSLPAFLAFADRLGDGALERVPVAADGDQFAGQAAAHRRARRLHARRRKARRPGA